MSWNIQISGHSTNDEPELVKVNQLAVRLVKEARELGLNPSYMLTGGNSGMTIKPITLNDVPA